MTKRSLHVNLRYHRQPERKGTRYAIDNIEKRNGRKIELISSSRLRMERLLGTMRECQSILLHNNFVVDNVLLFSSDVTKFDYESDRTIAR